ncbi:MAG: division/cell wall cluster transcriptional repressor MraZ [Clostridia bacterium]|nr:division/cell wall cluster transcriptional repressor MraZ [Clostridia bacterium]
MLFGEYSHQVDAKNRIRIPSKLKSELGSGYVFMKGAAKCISVYPADKVDQLVGQFSGLSTFDKVGQESLMEFMSSFYPGDEDGQGRVVIPENLRIYAGIDKEVVTIGMVNHVDIYSKEERDRIKAEKTYSERIDILKDRLK